VPKMDTQASLLLGSTRAVGELTKKQSVVGTIRRKGISEKRLGGQ